MTSFVEDYLKDPSNAIATAASSACNLLWSDQINEELIYQQISSAEFRLYEEMLDFCYLCAYDKYDNINDSDGSSSDSSADLYVRSPRIG